MAGVNAVLAGTRSMIKLPKKILSRQAEITHEYLAEVDKHLADILSGRIDRMYHIKDFASILFIHPVHLSNTIKLTTGHSPCYFFEEKLMNEARRLLQEGEVNIATIAERLTFDTSNFTKFFKRFEGLTPSAYRQQFYAQANRRAQEDHALTA
jgi:AraC-like DNA-binding protein